MNGDHKKLQMRDGVSLDLNIKEVGAPIWIIASHGIGEYYGRHEYIPKIFGQDFNICQYDLRGHGNSEGVSAYVDSFEHFYEDLGEIVSFLEEKYKMKRLILFGHSMGALITAGYLQNEAHKHLYPEVVFLNAPPVGMPGVMGDVLNLIPKSVFRALVKMPLTIKLGGLVDLNYLSHNVQIKEDYLADKLNHLKLHSKLLLELVKASKDVFSLPLRVECKAYCTYGSEDRVIDPVAIKNYFSHTEKSFRVKEIEGAYHEIHNEIEKYRSLYFKFLKESFYETLYSEFEA